METRSFGKSDLKTSAIGFGGWPMGKGHYGAFEDNEAIAAVRAALDAGVTLFDTAPVYGRGYSEELLAKALGKDRGHMVLVTKGGLKWNEATQRNDRNSSKEWLRECLEGSLKNLKTDYIDLYLIHWPDESRPMQEPMEAFAQFKKEGKIRYGGVSNFSAAQMEECLKHFPIVCNQVGYHLFDRRPTQEIFPFCQAHGIGVMVYGPLAHGLLTGTMTPDTKFGEDDWRRNGVAFGQPIFQGEHFLRNLAIVEKLKAIAARKGKAVAQLAIAWVLANPVVSVALTGARKPSEILENVKAAELKLTARDMKAIEAVFVEAQPAKV